MLHDSFKACYKTPFGAQVTDTKIKLHIDVPHNISTVTLRLWYSDGGEVLVPMHQCQDFKNDSLQRMEGAFFTNSVPGYVWYYFIIEEKVNDTIKRYYYGDNESHLGGKGQIYESNPTGYQITVYDKNNKFPKWTNDAVLYHIFVDRFNRGKISKPLGSGLKNNQLIHPNWDDEPMYIKDINGDVLQYDFFGGNLQGILEKLEYLKDLGVNLIYLSPIMDSISNHKYDVGDYKKIDEAFGDTTGFKMLIAKAHSYGMKVILDGVFSHTGAESIYFNKSGIYNSLGAYQSKNSPYFDWYRFENYPDKYECWWNMTNLPNVNEETKSYMDYIIFNWDSVIHHWHSLGIDGWRLDVADELPVKFLETFYGEVKRLYPEAIIIGEVWEDATQKEVDGKLRHYAQGSMLDSVMNYPFRSIVIDTLTQKISPKEGLHKLISLYENYPNQMAHSLMNLLSSHDETRIISALSEPPNMNDQPMAKRMKYKIPENMIKTALNRLFMAITWQCTSIGIPSIYYGDEIGLQGEKDPLNRRTFDWSKKNSEIRTWYKKMLKLRQELAVLRHGDFEILDVDEIIGFKRSFTNVKNDSKNLINNETYTKPSVVNTSGKKISKISESSKNYNYNSLNNRSINESASKHTRDFSERSLYAGICEDLANNIKLAKIDQDSNFNAVTNNPSSFNNYEDLANDKITKNNEIAKTLDINEIREKVKVKANSNNICDSSSIITEGKFNPLKDENLTISQNHNETNEVIYSQNSRATNKITIPDTLVMSDNSNHEFVKSSPFTYIDSTKTKSVHQNIEKKENIFSEDDFNTKINETFSENADLKFNSNLVEGKAINTHETVGLGEETKTFNINNKLADEGEMNSANGFAANNSEVNCSDNYTSSDSSLNNRNSFAAGETSGKDADNKLAGEGDVNSANGFSANNAAVNCSNNYTSSDSSLNNRNNFTAGENGGKNANDFAAGEAYAKSANTFVTGETSGKDASNKFAGETSVCSANVFASGEDCGKNTSNKLAAESDVNSANGFSADKVTMNCGNNFVADNAEVNCSDIYASNDSNLNNRNNFATGEDCGNGTSNKLAGETCARSANGFASGEANGKGADNKFAAEADVNCGNDSTIKISATNDHNNILDNSLAYILMNPKQEKVSLNLLLPAIDTAWRAISSKSGERVIFDLAEDFNNNSAVNTYEVVLEPLEALVIYTKDAAKFYKSMNISENKINSDNSIANEIKEVAKSNSSTANVLECENPLARNVNYISENAAINENANCSANISINKDSGALENSLTFENVIEGENSPISESANLGVNNCVLEKTNASESPNTSEKIKKAESDSKFGVLLHVTSLPNKNGIGDIGDVAYEWIDTMVENGQKYWQILPLTEPAEGNSPYTAFSLIAGDTRILSLEEMARQKFLTADEIISSRQALSEYGPVDIEKVMIHKIPLYRKAWRRFLHNDDAQKKYQEFCQKEANWLDTYALFQALKQRFHHLPWYKWGKFKRIEYAKNNSSFYETEMEYIKFLQWQFSYQWDKLHAYANEKGVKIIGDVPFFVAHDSVELWSKSEYFLMDENLNPTAIAGVPPDYFAKDGQCWGNPQYDWQALEAENYAWWIEQIKKIFQKVDIVRFDHFRGYEATWHIPYGEKTGVNGKWVKGPGIDLFEALAAEIPAYKAQLEGSCEIVAIAEDLGIITPEVRKLMADTKMPGMSVLPFVIGDEFNDFKDIKNRIFYTGTHDNNTILGWLSEIKKEEAKGDSKTFSNVCKFLGLANTSSLHKIHQHLLKWTLEVNSKITIIPMQDILGLDDKHRMNVPGTVNDRNWLWRVPV